jgi:hypothetical protein
MSGSHGFRLALNILQIYIDKMNKPLKKRLVMVKAVPMVDRFLRMMSMIMNKLYDRVFVASI